MIGRRRPDQDGSSLPDDIQRGDYWRVVGSSWQPIADASPGNLTKGVWMIAVPMGDGDEYSIGTLVHHTVREHEDGTISVRPGDGSSNSILQHQGRTGRSWHGYIERGEWRAC